MNDILVDKYKKTILPGVWRDTTSGALINLDTKALMEYKKQRDQREEYRQQFFKVKETTEENSARLDNIENTLGEIKDTLGNVKDILLKIT